MKKFFAKVVLVTLCSTQLVFAGIDHYWSGQFGGSASLLGGSNIASISDASATFYNPGALGRVEGTEVSFNGNGYGIENQKIKGGAGPNTDLKTTNVLIFPTLIAGVKKFSDDSNHVFAYSLLTRNKFSSFLNGRRDEQIDVLDNNVSPGLEEYVGQYSSSTEINEIWAGLSWAARLTDNMSFGTTAYVGYLKHSAFSSIAVRAIDNNFSVALTDLSLLADFYNIRGLLKLGIAYELEKMMVGLTYTTKSYNLTGSGTTAGDFTASNIIQGFDNNNNPVFLSFVGNDRQEDLNSNYKSPDSVALGIEVPLENDVLISATIEHFFPVSRYQVNSPASKDFFRPSNAFTDNDSKDIIGLSDARKSVTNVAVGASLPMGNRFTFLAGFKTDFSSAPDSEAPAIGVVYSEWDIFHASSGVEWKRKNETVSAGIIYSFSFEKSINADANFDNPTAEGLLLGPDTKAKASFSSFLLNIGYTKHF